VTKGRTDWFGPTFGMPFIVSVTPDNKPDLVSCCWHCTPSLFLQATHSTPKTTTKMSTDDASRDSPHSRVHTACHCLRWSSPQTIPRMSRQGAEVSIYSFFNVGAGWGWVVKATPGRLTSGKDAVRFVQETRQGLGKYGNPPPRLRHRAVEAVSSRYTDWAIPIRGQVADCRKLGHTSNTAPLSGGSCQLKWLIRVANIYVFRAVSGRLSASGLLCFDGSTIVSKVATYSCNECHVTGDSSSDWMRGSAFGSRKCGRSRLSMSAVNSAVLLQPYTTCAHTEIT